MRLFFHFSRSVMYDGFDWKRRLFSGSVQGYPSYEEALNILNFFLFSFPDLIRREIIGRSSEDRPIYVYRVFAESSQVLGDVPRAVVVGLLHGNEPVTVISSIFAIGILLEEYRLNVTETVYLLRGRELYVIPFANPDAYAAGSAVGNFHFRKTRRKTCFSRHDHSGVDLNRNFGLFWRNTTYLDPCHIEYAGDGPFSEPESAAIRDFLTRSSFTSSLILHSYGEMLIYPFNGDPSARVNESHIQYYEEIRTVFGIDKAGSASSMLKYTTTGEATDYMYGSLGIVSMSLEIGTDEDGFFPGMDRVLSIAEINSHRIKHWMFKSGAEFSRAKVIAHEAKSETVLIRIYNSGLSPHNGDLILLSTQCSKERLLRISNLPKGWSDSLEIKNCEPDPDNTLGGFCILENDILCRCFQFEGNRAEIPLGTFSSFQTNARECLRLGAPPEILSRVNGEPVEGLAYPYIIGASVSLIICLILLLKVSRNVLSKT
jgi:hypothetical protein